MMMMIIIIIIVGKSESTEGRSAHYVHYIKCLDCEVFRSKLG
jgi:hypothetical protein